MVGFFSPLNLMAFGEQTFSHILQLMHKSTLNVGTQASATISPPERSVFTFDAASPA
jgi:hypothetical protein